jgi:hypothetical protein
MRSSIAKLRWVAVALAGILLTDALVVNCEVEIQPVLAAQEGRIIPSDPKPLGPRVAGNDPIHDQIEQVQHAQMQKQLIQDTDKLLALAKQLKEEVDRSNGGTLPVDAVKKAAEIEKLAKSVKSKLRY